MSRTRKIRARKIVEILDGSFAPINNAIESIRLRGIAEIWLHFVHAIIFIDVDYRTLASKFGKIRADYLEGDGARSGCL